jgi:hypothetical protein
VTRFLAFACCALLVQGCAAIPAAVALGAMGAVPGEQDAAQRDTASAAVAEASRTMPVSAPARLGVLEAQDLAPGACAIFLFSRGQPSEFVAFATPDGQTLTLNLDGETQTLPAAAPLAPSSDRFAQVYRGEDALEARLSVSFGETLPQGRRAPEASLRLAAPGGSAQVTPLSGLLACEAPDPEIS